MIILLSEEIDFSKDSSETSVIVSKTWHFVKISTTTVDGQFNYFLMKLCIYLTTEEKSLFQK